MVTEEIRHRVFMSYASEDGDLANTVCAHLERAGLSCWIAPRDVTPGREYASEIMRGIEACDSVVLLLSEHANASPMVRKEIERAISKGKPVFPRRHTGDPVRTIRVAGETRRRHSAPAHQPAHLPRLMLSSA
jgi:hypothetical protein